MYSLIGLVILVFLVVRVSQLSSRVSSLEKRLDMKSASNAAVPPPMPSLTPYGEPMGVPVMETVKKDTVATEERNQVIEWLQNNWLSKLGVLLVLIGFGWFVSYAFVHNWIGPAGRIALGFGLGSVLALLGAWRIRANAVQANILLVLGSAIVLMTAYAARIVYDFFTPELVLALSFLVAAYVTTLAAVFGREKLAVYGVLIALAAPLLTHAPEPSVIGLFAYLAVVSAASIWVSAAKSWGSANLAAIIGVLLYCLPFVFGNAASVPEMDHAGVVAIALLLAFAFFITNVVQMLRAGEKETQSTAYIAVANALLIFSVIQGIVIEELRSFFLAAWVIVFAIGSAIVSAKGRQPVFFYLYSLVAILFLGIATAIELDGPVLAIAFSIEAAIVSVAAYLVTRDLGKSAYLSLLMLVPVAAALPSLYSGAWHAGIFHDDALVVVLVSSLLFLLGSFLMSKYRKGTDSEGVRSIYLAHAWGGAFFAFSFVWLAAHAVFSDDFAVIVSLTVYTLVGIGTYLQGVFSERKIEKTFGALVLILVIARLLIVDVWQMPLGPRIIVFIVIGILLVSTAFIGRKKAPIAAPPAPQP